MADASKKVFTGTINKAAVIAGLHTLLISLAFETKSGGMRVIRGVSLAWSTARSYFSHVKRYNPVNNINFLEAWLFIGFVGASQPFNLARNLSV